jgi:aryl-alcohol dehydrogenase-like predicted oxidoreductase
VTILATGSGETAGIGEHERSEARRGMGAGCYDRPVEQRPLGSTEISVPVVGMGTWRTFDVRGEAAEGNARAVVNVALESKACLFDSSPMYGEAERVLALALERRREEALVATKVWARVLDEGREQIERALRFFGGRVDLYQIHNLVSWREHLPVLESLRDRGAVRAVGATHFSASAFGELRRVMETGRIGFVQISYNPREREVEREILPLAAERGIGVVVMRPFAEGGLVRRSPSACELEPPRPFGVTTWAQALIKWVLSDERCHTTIPATSKPDRMRENAAAGGPPWFGPEEREYVSRLAHA